MIDFHSQVLEEPGPENTRYDNLTPVIVKPATSANGSMQNLDDFDPFTMEIPYEVCFSYQKITNPVIILPRQK